jgi:hypothetical protein
VVTVRVTLQEVKVNDAMMTAAMQHNDEMMNFIEPPFLIKNSV